MNDKNEMLQQVRVNMSVLEEENREEYDRVTALFAMLHETTNLLGKVFHREKIKQWKDEEDPSFYRFASLLKKALEQQKDYLESVSDQLLPEGDIVTQKIAANSERIFFLLQEEQIILNEAESLLKQQTELRERKARVEVLQNRKEELTDIKKKYVRINMEKLQSDIEKKGKLMAELTNKCAPLLKKQAELQNAIAELSAAEKNLDSELDRLENAYGEKSQEISEKLSYWIDKIRARRLERDSKAVTYEIELAKEAAELHETEKVIRERLEELGRMHSAAMDNFNTLVLHFAANQKIGGNFLDSFSLIESELSALLTAVEQKLSNFDDLLKNAQQKHQEIAAAFKPKGIGG